MAKKTTKKENFGKIIEILKGAEREDLVAVMEHEIELIEKKASNGKKTKTQEANDSIKKVMLAEMERIGRAVTISELIKESEEIDQMSGGSNQKVSALMTQLKNTNQVVRIQDGKKAMFTLPKED